MKICFVGIVSLFFITSGVVGQTSFSEDRQEFYRQAQGMLNGLGTEAAQKVAFDFKNAWEGNFTAAQKDQIHSIALQMERKGYQYHPHFWYFFSYLAFSVAQEGITSDQVSAVLKINDQVVKSMTTEEYTNFLFGLNTFFARRILAYSKNILSRVEDGSYTFKQLDPVVETEESVLDMMEEAAAQEPDVVTEPEIQDDQSTDTFSSWDTGTDPWGSSTSWDSGDSWDSGSSWEDSDTWSDSSDPEPAEPVRQVVIASGHDYVMEKKTKYRSPVVDGPVIELVNNNMLIATPYDSFKIKEISGNFLLKNRVFAGSKAVINWPEEHVNMRGATVLLGDFHMNADWANFWTPNAELTFPSLFSGNVKGAFTFKSVRRSPRTLSNFPEFVSYNSDVTLNLGQNLKYTGGVKLAGSKLFGTSVSKTPSRLEILDGKGNSVVIRAVEFAFVDSTIVSENGSITFRHGLDTIHHPSVHFKYDRTSRQLTAYRTKDFNVTPWYSSYFDMHINADLVKWDLEQDSMDISILNGKDLVPANVTSDQFFNDIRFKKMTGFYPFHPVATPVFYAKKYGIKTFNEGELVSEFDLDPKLVKGAMRMLKQYGFASYDAETGQVTLHDLAFHFYDASARKKDYDNVMIPSLSPDLPNITWRLDSGQLATRGVSRFYLTSDFQVYVEPDSGYLEVLKGRDIQFDGMINAGEFQYRGKNFRFYYDDFYVEMGHIDSIRIQIATPDSLKGRFTPDKMSLSNHLTMTTGTLYLDNPQNKSGLVDNPSFPSFNSNSDAIVYFDGKEILNGAYDRSVKFIMPPFNVDSIEQNETRAFEGKFISGGIFPSFDETLRIMPDHSLGFVHQIPPEGYNLYGTEAKTYEKIELTNRGIRGGGKIDFITTTIYSNDFVYYPDSVSSYGSGGEIRPGEVNGASYPEAHLGPFKMHWLPRIDSMYLKNIDEPFTFYHNTAELDGEANITSRGVFGSGQLLTRGSKSISSDLTFKQYSYSARHAKFEILTNVPDKPAMAGNDIRLQFDLTKDIATIQPEKQGVAAISFPYAQMKTSITNAVWYLDDSVVTMTKPPEVPIEDSYFYSTRPELDSLAFNAESAEYDINTFELHVKGIQYIKVADAKIIPENNETVILQNSELQPFNNAQIIMDTSNNYHYLKNGNIKIISRKQFAGNAVYQFITANDTVDIKFENFETELVPIKEGVKKPMTVSHGEVFANQELIISPGFFYKGPVKMYAGRKALELSGQVKLDVQNNVTDVKWINYERKIDQTEVLIDIEKAVYEDEEPVIAGLFYDARGKVYTVFAEETKGETDERFFRPQGLLAYDTAYRSFRIESPEKTAGQSYGGQTLIYNDNTQDVIFEGKVNFFSPRTEHVKITSAVLGTGNRLKEQYTLDAFLAIDLPGMNNQMTIMSEDLIDIIERLGAAPANDISLETMYKLSSVTSDAVAKMYETETLKAYRPMFSFSETLLRSLVITSVKMKWSAAEAAWYNTTKLGISNSFKYDINSKLDGFLEIKKDATNQDVMNLFIQAAPGIWYFISYQQNNLILFSSNDQFNRSVESMSNVGRSRPGELVIVLGDQNETLGFINEFREKYFGVTQPYNLVVPGDNINVEDETFETIEKDDDGFGF